VVSRRDRGFTLAEVLVSMSVFMVVLTIMFMLTREMRTYEKKMPVNMMRHPQTSAVLARLRKDVLSGIGSQPFKDHFQDYDAEDATNLCIIEYLNDGGFLRTVVWDFRTSGQAIRLEFNAGEPAGQWLARGVPAFTVERIDRGSSPDALELKAVDDRGNLAIDQIYIPRSH
jgi:hypothetical protein